MYTKGFFLTEPVGNNEFSFEKRENKHIWIPSIKEIQELDDIELQDNKEKVAFEDFGFDDELSTNYGLKNFYRIKAGNKEIILVDNHNHVLYFWYEARKRGIIGDNNLLIHIDEHADTRDNDKWISKEDSEDLEKVFHFTNFVCNVGDYIVPAEKEGIIGEVMQIRNSLNLEEYTKNPPENLLKGGKRGIILNLDLDFFQPDLDFINYELKKKVVKDAFLKADFITVCTSPFFIDQDLAFKVFKDLFGEYL